MTHLHQFWHRVVYQVDLHQFQPRPERPEARRLQYRLSGGIKVLTAVVCMDLGKGLPTGSMSPSAFVAKNVVSASIPTLDVGLEGVDEPVSGVLSVFRDGEKESTAQALLTSMSKPSPYWELSL